APLGHPRFLASRERPIPKLRVAIMNRTSLAGFMLGFSAHQYSCFGRSAQNYPCISPPFNISQIGTPFDLGEARPVASQKPTPNQTNTDHTIYKSKSLLNFLIRVNQCHQCYLW